MNKIFPFSFPRLLGALFMTMLFAGAPGMARALTVYTAGPGGLIKKLAAGFELSTGVKVDIFQATTGKVLARLEAESASPRADVLISASWDTAIDLDRRGMLLAYSSPNAAEVPSAFKTPTYVAQGISALGIIWNTSSGAPEPQDWADLAKPAFRGLVTLPDPALSGAALDLLLGLQQAHGDQAWKLFDALKANGAQISGPNAQALAPVLQGAKAAVFGGVDYVTLANAAKGEPIKVIFPPSGTVIAPRPMMILKTTRHADQAKQFVDYVLSPAGQELVAQAWLMPARTDIKPVGQRPGIAELKQLPVSTQALSPTQRQAVLDRFNALFSRP